MTLPEIDRDAAAELLNRRCRILTTMRICATFLLVAFQITVRFEQLVMPRSPKQTVAADRQRCAVRFNGADEVYLIETDCTGDNKGGD